MNNQQYKSHSPDAGEIVAAYILHGPNFQNGKCRWQVLKQQK